ncbi:MULTISPECIES: ABC transporter permease [unclassified Paenibacillus]|uniref:ABC transporter permease n=1 Tax=unclassified Paenibacillus TaxID=185978 RepID=UPI000956B479|nr:MULTISPECIES: ABC transporter permease [unclassified Paenibacillus]ASS65780.1 ABC transporter permease [Paenibacillus sp. RUD330]SIQ24067.1 ABC-type nitrate/sulfonate/bicarbonate transport system, permease component [Paenibacillus sp. RU4X]SIQ45802.1 ABC-type nitrate/sulfonate/bicarbonate transport system, permease component [Paenibacillus sp. RU4T]
MDSRTIRWGALLPPVVVMAAFLLLWEAAVRLSGTEAWLLPAPSDIARDAWAARPRLAEHTGATLSLTLLGFAGGAAAGLLLGAVLHLLPLMRSGFYPLLVLSQNIPVIAIGPLLVIWFGFGLLPKLLLVMLVCFFPVCVAMLGGLQGADPGLERYMRMIGAGRWRRFLSLELPGSLPQLFSGLKIAASYSVTSAVVAEWIGSDRGLGYFMLLSSKGFKTSLVFAGVALVVLLSLLLFAAVAGAEKLALSWRPRKEGGR